MGRKSLRVTPARAALAALALATLPMASFAFVSVGVSINIAPPALPVYVQPPCPAVGYIWTPGYWAWDDGDYYWVPGTWVLPPAVGFLWTPGYWGWSSGIYLWHPGYWGPHVGFYGGINYGYGYTGVGFEGGYWSGGAFYYNRAVANMGDIHVTNVYNRTVVNNVTINRVSYNGGEGGLQARPTARELAAEHDRHVDFTPVQREHEHLASGNHDLRASVNGGKPRIAATARPAVFAGRGVVSARAAGAPYHAGIEPGGPGRGVQAHAAGHGGPGPGPEVRSAERSSALMRSDRPPNATMHGGPAGGFSGGGAPNIGHPEAHVAQPRMNQMNGMRMERSAPRLQNAPHVQEAPRPQVVPHMQQAPRPQVAPRPQNMPRPENMPRPDNRHAGGEPHGQGEPQRYERSAHDFGRR